MEVITIESGAFYRLIEEIVARLTEAREEPPEYVAEEEAMQILGIRSKTTLWKLRTEGKIAYTQPSRKIILYHRQSLSDYLNEHLNETF